MTDAPDPVALVEDYVLMKRGLFYRPNAMGYTGIKEHAGRYAKSDAESRADPISGVTALRFSDAPLVASNCFDDIAVKYLTDCPESRAAVIQAHAARIAELEGESVERVFEHIEPEDGDWSSVSLTEIADLAAFGWESGVETLYQDADHLDRKGQPGTGGRVRCAANFIRRALVIRQARSLLSERVRRDCAEDGSVPSVSDDRPVTSGEGWA